MQKPEKITLETYVSVLREVADAGLKNLHEYESSDSRRRIVKELLDSGFLSDARQTLGYASIVNEVILTPSGASALLEWSDYLNQQTLWHKAGKAISQLIWVCIGAVAASIPQLFG